MINFIAWYVLVTLIGMAAFPLAFRLFPSLADHGYVFSRPLGLLVWGYMFWILASLGVLQNNTTGLLFSLALLLLLSAWSLRTVGTAEISSWFKTNLKYLAGVEALFLIAFAAWAFIRAMTPDATGTEKPMELAFINAISRSKTFPPNDPWLSGYSISYYYFGYVLTAILAGITRVPGSLAFNLQMALTFALSACGAYGVVNNLLSAKQHGRGPDPEHETAKFSTLGLLGPLFLLLVSNLEGFLHALHTRGIFWTANDRSELTSAFWRWLDIKDLNLPPGGEFSWVPTRFWWWWRASRVVQDYDLAGNVREIIDEFPFFSYLLADLHPHVLAMPFAFLAIAVGLNLLLGGAGGHSKWTQFRLNLSSMLWLALITVCLGAVFIIAGFNSLNMLKGFAGIALILIGFFILFLFRRELRAQSFSAWFSTGMVPIRVGREIHLDWVSLLSISFILGSIAFLNTWDMLLFLLLIPGSYVLNRILAGKVDLLGGLQEFLWLVVISAVGAFILFLPFFTSFSSQAGGIIPNLIYPTRGAHFWVMFAPLLVPILCFLWFMTSSAQNKTNLRRNLKRAAWISFVLVMGLWVFSIFLGVSATFIPEVNDLFMGSLAAVDLNSLLFAALNRRIISSGALITMAVLLVLSLGLLLGLENRSYSEDTGGQKGSRRRYSNAFAVLLIFLGGMFVLGPEFIYLRDQFGWRMNTIFKFYYQTWLIWSIAAAYASALLLIVLKKPWSYVFRVVFIAVTAMSLVYPALSLWNKTGGFNTSKLTFDSSAYLKDTDPDEYAAINWLQSAPDGVIAEAVSPTGGSYTNYARMSTHSGLPAVLGWIGHESQWRGGNLEMGSRQSDIERLYCSRQWEVTRQILDRYDIRYVVLGALERSTYKPNQGNCPAGLDESKFQKYFVPVFKQGSVTVYEYASN